MAADALTFEKVWAMFQETDQRWEETRRESDRRWEETRREARETDRRLEEAHQKMTRTIEKVSQQIGELGNRFGELAEHLVAPNIMEKFNALGLNFTRTAQDLRLRDPLNNQTMAEVDIYLENEDTVIAVEVKSKPLTKDVDRHLERMEVLRRSADQRQDRRRIRGAIAGAIFYEGVKKYAQDAGFYVIEQTGDTVRIDVPPGFSPRDW